jgi:hypothetical protein
MQEFSIAWIDACVLIIQKNLSFVAGDCSIKNVCIFFGVPQNYRTNLLSSNLWSSLRFFRSMFLHTFFSFFLLKSVIKICVTIYLATFYSSVVILMHKWPSVLTGILIFSIFSQVFIVTEYPGHLYFTTSALSLVPFKHLNWSDGIFSICLT